MSRKPSDHIGIKKAQIVRWAAMTTTCVAIFSLGVFLGKQFNNSHKKQLSQTPHTKDDEVKDYKVKLIPRESHSKSEIVRRIAEDIVISSPSKEEDKAKPREEKSETVKSLILKQKQSKMEKQDKTKEQKTKTLVANTVKSSATPILPEKISENLSAKYTIQVYTSTEEKQAISYVEDLKQQGLDAFYVSFNEEDKTWYRISMGVYASKDSAERERNRILKTTSIKEASVQEILKGSF